MGSAASFDDGDSRGIRQRESACGAKAARRKDQSLEGRCLDEDLGSNNAALSLCVHVSAGRVVSPVWTLES